MTAESRLHVAIRILIPSTASSEVIELAEQRVRELEGAPGIDEISIEIERTCAVCGCTDDEACPGGCWWVDLVDAGAPRDICSSCAESS